ncbi:MAG: N,N-dimethylformamidase large subunit, partial [Alphaproteobacteria bacterium]
MDYLPIAGYCDKLSVRPGEKIRFYVSSQSERNFSARLHRSICADPNPKGPGIIEEDASQYFPASSFPSRFQPISIGSYAETTSELKPTPTANISIKFWFMPTRINAGNQVIFSWGNLSVSIQNNGQLSV